MKKITAQTMVGIKSRQGGLSLIELMVAMVLGLVLVFGVAEIYVNSKATYGVNEEMSRLQENARFAFDLMIPGIRLAGFSGCANINARAAFNNASPQDFPFASDEVIAGHEYSGSSWSPALPGSISGSVESDSDVISVQTTESCNGHLVVGMGTPSADVQIDGANTCDLAAGDSVVVSDCSDIDVFTVTGVSGSGPENVAHGNTLNLTNSLNKAYQLDAELFKANSLTYYIGTGAGGIPSLRQVDNLSATDVELVEGIESMQVLYGIDTSATVDGIADRYVTASDIPVAGHDWDRVVSARISLLMRSIDAAAAASKSYDFNGVTFGPDRFLRQEYTSTIQLRNRNLLP